MLEAHSAAQPLKSPGARTRHNTTERLWGLPIDKAALLNDEGAAAIVDPAGHPLRCDVAGMGIIRLAHQKFGHTLPGQIARARLGSVDAIATSRRPSRRRGRSA